MLTASARPESGVEATIAGIWQDVLHIPVVGLDDNFFDLGGHSLLTVQVLARVREHTGQNIPITDMFRFPTVRLLAAASQRRDQGLGRARTRPGARRRAAECTAASAPAVVAGRWRDLRKVGR